MRANPNGLYDRINITQTLLDGGSLASYLTPVKSWLDANPNEVISILIVNIDSLPPTSFSAVYESVGLDALSYAPTSASLASSAWPTLGEMIDSGKRLVNFMDYKADFTQVPYIIDGESLFLRPCSPPLVSRRGNGSFARSQSHGSVVVP